MDVCGEWKREGALIRFSAGPRPVKGREGARAEIGNDGKRIGFGRLDRPRKVKEGFGTRTGNPGVSTKLHPKTNRAISYPDTYDHM